MESLDERIADATRQRDEARARIPKLQQQHADAQLKFQQEMIDAELHAASAEGAVRALTAIKNDGFTPPIAKAPARRKR